MYQYEHLDADQIRILTLYPSKLESSAIECSLASHSLDTKPTFEALSYTWGDPGDICPTPIILEGHPTLISSNLETALRTLRGSALHREFWIDALCINQRNNDEKSHQITIMGDVFELAEKVIIWLGPESEDSKLAISKLSRTLTDIEEGSVRELEHDEWTAFENLFKRPWFSRIWVLQEFKRARRPYFHCGNASLDWNSIESAFRQTPNPGRVYNLYNISVENVKGTSKIASLGYIRIQLLDEERLNSSDDSRAAQCLVRVLQIYGRTRTATVPHDRIYGLLGLSNAFSFSHSLPPCINYDSSVLEVYKEWARFLIATGKSLDLLHLSQPVPQNSSLPSWVPDWRVVCRDLPLTLNFFQASFQYNGLFPKSYNNIIYFEDNGKVLSVQGFAVATLTCDLYQFSEIGPHFFEELFENQKSNDFDMVCIVIDEELKMASAGHTASLWISKGRKLFLGPEDIYGLVPNTAQHGDMICVLGNTAVPFLLRRDGDHFILIGDAYFNTGSKLRSSKDPMAQTFKIR